MNFGFSNLLGSPYRGGNACFHKDVLYVSVGNRVAKVQLDTTVTSVLKFETQCDIDHIALRPDGAVMAVVDKLGRLMLVRIYPCRSTQTNVDLVATNTHTFTD